MKEFLRDCLWPFLQKKQASAGRRAWWSSDGFWSYVVITACSFKEKKEEGSDPRKQTNDPREPKCTYTPAFADRNGRGGAGQAGGRSPPHPALATHREDRCEADGGERLVEQRHQVEKHGQREAEACVIRAHFQLIPA